MKELKDKITENLLKLKNQTEAKEYKLKNDNRDDEALIEKIKANIVDIFISVLDVSYHQTIKAEGSEQDMLNKFSKFFDLIPQNWIESKKQAEAKNDLETNYKEDAKIAMAKQIKKIFVNTVEEYHVR